MPVDWYILNADGQKAGPYSLDQLRSFWANGQVTLDTPYWREGLAEWEPIRTIENSLRPARAIPPQTATSPTQVPAKPLAFNSPKPAPPLYPTKPPRSGCSTLFLGCLITLAIPPIAFVLVIAFGAVVSSMLASGSNAAPNSSHGDAEKAADDKLYKDGFALGYGFAVVYHKLEQNKGAPKESSEALDANAKGCLPSLGLVEGNERADGFIDGFRQGYGDAWTDEASALKKMHTLYPPPPGWPPSDIEISDKNTNGIPDNFVLSGPENFSSYLNESGDMTTEYADKRKALPDAISPSEETALDDELRAESDQLLKRYIEEGKTIIVPAGEYKITAFFDGDGHPMGKTDAGYRSFLWVEFVYDGKQCYCLLSQPSTVTQSAPIEPTGPSTKQEWKSKVPGDRTVLNLSGKLLCNNYDLFNAVGAPDKTETLGDHIYLTWKCSDGWIHLDCPATQYRCGLIYADLSEE